MIKILPNFELKEFFVGCSFDERQTAYRDIQVMSNLFLLCQIMQSIRVHLGKPVIITSGYRDFEHNKRVGGVPFSQHIEGCACDFKVSGVSDYKKLAKELGKIVDFDQMIAYDSFIHISFSSNRYVDFNRNVLILKK